MTENRIRNVYEIMADINYAGRYFEENAERGNQKRALYWSRRIDKLTEELAESRRHNRIEYARRYRGL